MKDLRIGKTGVFFLLLAVALTQSAFAQDERAPLTVRIDQIITSDFPNMTMYVIVENDREEAVLGLAPALFNFRINSFEETGRVSITQFAQRNAPIDYSIIFSNSGIMSGEPLDFQKNAILQFVEAMRANDRLSLYTIGEEATAIFEELRRDDIDPAVINAIGVSAAQPRLNDSVINVLRRTQRRRIERRVVIVISDGRDINSRFTAEQLSAVLAEVGVPVYALGFRMLGAETLANLHNMAEQTGGAYLYVPQVSGLPANLRTLNARIAQPYVINLRARSLRADDLPHVIEVAVAGRDFAGSGQRTFVATRVPVPQWVRFAGAIAAGVLVLAALAAAIIRRIVKRKRMGITRRRCKECSVRMKDTWDSCPFCRYLPNMKKKKKKAKAM
jgi:hypothetical protein